MLDSARTIEELTTSFSDDLKANGVASEYADEIAKKLITDYAVFEVPAPPQGTLTLLIGQYAIRKDDIKLFDLLTGGLTAASGVAFFTGHQPVLAANVAIGMSFRA